MTLYVVTEGEYSDYHIVGIYSTKEQAEKVKKYYSGLWDYPDIEEWELDGDVPEDIESMREYYRVTHYIDQWLKDTWTWKRFTKVGEEAKKEFSWNFFQGIRKEFTIDIPCDRVKDEKHAIKIAKDKRAELIAMREGIT